MKDDSMNPQEFNAQTQKLRTAVQQGESLSTRRSGPLGQIFFCDGCCCGRSEKGFPPLPKEMIKERWKSLKLNGTIQLTISGCLGPCDLANVFYLLGSDGVGQWFGGLSDPWHYETLIHWASECQLAGSLLPIPETLEGHRFTRFESVSNSPEVCSLKERKLHETS
jgi:hypothetical protein